MISLRKFEEFNKLANKTVDARDPNKSEEDLSSDTFRHISFSDKKGAAGAAADPFQDEIGSLLKLKEVVSQGVTSKQWTARDLSKNDHQESKNQTL